MSRSASEGRRLTAAWMKRWFWRVALWVCLGGLGISGGCVAMNASHWGPSGGGFVRLFGDAGPQKPFGPDTVSQWMAQPRPQP